jgi:hypothetical protein
MATRSTIAVKHEDGTVSQIYCHYDGYLSGVGKMLMTHYNTLLAAEFLVSKGSLSVLAERVTPNPEVGIHNFDVAQNGVCVYYGRDRGDEDTEPNTFVNVSSYLDLVMCEEYNYFFNGEFWEVQTDGDFVSVEEAMKLEAEDCE